MRSGRRPGRRRSPSHPPWPRTASLSPPWHQAMWRRTWRPRTWPGRPAIRSARKAHSGGSRTPAKSPQRCSTWRLRRPNGPAARSSISTAPHTCGLRMTGMAESPAGLTVTTAFELPGMTVERDLGVAFGLVVRSMGLARSVGAGLKALRQGEVTQYTQLLEDSRRHAIDRMIENARLLGANALIAVRFDSSEIGQQLTEIVAYGTAVVVGPAA